MENYCWHKALHMLDEITFTVLLEISVYTQTLMNNCTVMCSIHCSLNGVSVCIRSFHFSKITIVSCCVRLSLQPLWLCKYNNQRGLIKWDIFSFLTDRVYLGQWLTVTRSVRKYDKYDIRIKAYKSFADRKITCKILAAAAVFT